MEIRLIEESEKDLAYWQKKHNTKILKRISELLLQFWKIPKPELENLNNLDIS